MEAVNRALFGHALNCLGSAWFRAMCHSYTFAVLRVIFGGVRVVVFEMLNTG